MESHEPASPHIIYRAPYDPLDYPILDLVTVPWHYRQEVRLRKKLHQVRVDEERPRGLGEFVLFPLLFTHSLRRSHVKCNVVAKPTITHRQLTQRARPKVETKETTAEASFS